MSSLSASRRDDLQPVIGRQALQRLRARATLRQCHCGDVGSLHEEGISRRGARQDGPEEEKRLVAKLKAFTKQPTLSQGEISGDPRQHRYCLADWKWRSEGHVCAACSGGSTTLSVTGGYRYRDDEGDSLQRNEPPPLFGSSQKINEWGN
jgi:hypothetical protein